jgi:hypothetical protein
MISGFDLLCLKKTKDGYPIHPLYVATETEPLNQPNTLADLIMRTNPLLRWIASCKGAYKERATLYTPSSRAKLELGRWMPEVNDASGESLTEACVLKRFQPGQRPDPSQVGSCDCLDMLS